MKRMTMMVVAVAAAGFSLLALAQYKVDTNLLGRDEQDLLKLDQKWVEALLHADTAALDKILGDEYTMVGPDGEVTSKTQEIANHKSGDLKFDSFTTQDLKARVYVGGAVLTGRATVKGKFKDTDINGDYRFTDVYESRKGTWQAVATQLTKIQTK